MWPNWNLSPWKLIWVWKPSDPIPSAFYLMMLLYWHAKTSYIWVFCPFDFIFFFHSRKLFQRETQGETKGHESPSDLKAQLESLGTDLSFFMTFTGFQFTSHSKKTVEKSKQFCALYWAYWLQFICKPMFYFTVSRKTITLKYNKVWFTDKTVSE